MDEFSSSTCIQLVLHLQCISQRVIIGTIFSLNKQLDTYIIIHADSSDDLMYLEKMISRYNGLAYSDSTHHFMLIINLSL